MAGILLCRLESVGFTSSVLVSGFVRQSLMNRIITDVLFVIEGICFGGEVSGLLEKHYGGEMSL